MRRRARPRRAPEGFTLLELLVALAVFALAAAALLRLSAENTRLATHLETRALAGVVAGNLAVEAAIAPTPQGETGVTDLAGRRWRWTRTPSATDDPDLIRIDIQVGPDDAADPAVAAGLTLFRDARP